MSQWTRRRFLSTTMAAAAVAAPGPAPLAERLGVMCQLGADEKKARATLAAAAQAGFRLIQVNLTWNRVNDSFLRGLPSWIKAEGLRCEILSAYVNCLRPDVLLMGTRREDFTRALEYAAEVEAHRLVAWTGSYSADLMAPDARNPTAASEDAIVRFLEPALAALERLKLKLALESYITLACPDAASLRRLFQRLPVSVGAVLDPPNLTPLKRYGERDAVLREMVQTLRGRVVVVHMKDFRMGADGASYQLPGPLAGEMNYRLFVDAVNALPPDVPAIAEHIEPEAFAETRRKLLAL